MTGNTIILDACLTITFGNAEALHVVARLGRHRLAISRRAAREVTRAPAIDQLNSAVRDGLIKLEGINLDVAAEQEVLVRFDSSPRFRGRGDAEVLALAASRGWIVGSDEIAIRRTTVSELGAARIAGTLDFLRWAVIEKRLPVGEAVHLLGNLDVGAVLIARIVAAGRTPEDVLGG